MPRYIFAILHAVIFLIVFMGIPYIIGDWVHLWWSWLIALLITVSIDEHTPEK